MVDLTKMGDTICNYLVICEGNTPTQVSAIAESVEDEVRVQTGVKPTVVDGTRNCLWVAMDYIDIVVHVFVPDAREFYDLDHLWEDADTMEIKNLD